MTSALQSLHTAFTTLTLASVLAPGVALAEDTTCRERVYQSERDRGASHTDAVEHAKEACPVTN